MQEIEFKKICGQLIGYYRKLNYQITKSYPYTQRGIILKNGDEKEFKFQKTLCSTTTLRLLESGVSQKNEWLYVYLAKKVNRKYLYSRRHIKKIYQLSERVNDLIENMELKKMKELQEKLQAHTHHQYLFYDECLQVFSSLLSFYTYQEFPSYNVIKQFEQTIEFFSKYHLQKMMLHLICEYYRRVHYQPELVLKLIQRYPEQNMDYMYLYTIIPCLISNHQHILALNALRRLKKNHDFSKNQYKQFYYYHMKACILTSIDFHQANGLLEKCEIIIQNQQHFTHFQQAAFYHNLGFRMLVLHRYKEAVDNFIHAASLNQKIVPAMLPYLFEACLKSNIGFLPVQNIILSCNTKLKGLYASYLKYFTIRCHLENKLQANVLEKCILSEILPVLKIAGQDGHRSNYLRDFFLKELQILNDWTHSSNILKQI